MFYVKEVESGSDPNVEVETKLISFELPMV